MYKSEITDNKYYYSEEQYLEKLNNANKFEEEHNQLIKKNSKFYTEYKKIIN